MLVNMSNTDLVDCLVGLMGGRQRVVVGVPVTTWLEPRMTRLSGVTLREAVKPLPEPTRTALLALRAPR